MARATEMEKLKYWIDAEFTILHIMFGIIMLQLTHGVFPTVFFSLYITVSVLYTLIRIAYIASIDKNYLKVPKQ
jgi:hypothetical protein